MSKTTLLAVHAYPGIEETFISRMLNAGVDGLIVAAITGLDIKQIQTYAHISLDAKRRALHQARLAMMAASTSTPKEPKL